MPRHSFYQPLPEPSISVRLSSIFPFFSALFIVPSVHFAPWLHSFLRSPAVSPALCCGHQVCSVGNETEEVTFSFCLTPQLSPAMRGLGSVMQCLIPPEPQTVFCQVGSVILPQRFEHSLCGFQSPGDVGDAQGTVPKPKGLRVGIKN